MPDNYCSVRGGLACLCGRDVPSEATQCRATLSMHTFDICACMPHVQRHARCPPTGCRRVPVQLSLTSAGAALALCASASCIFRLPFALARICFASAGFFRRLLVVILAQLHQDFGVALLALVAKAAEAPSMQAANL